MTYSESQLLTISGIRTQIKTKAKSSPLPTLPRGSTALWLDIKMYVSSPLKIMDEVVGHEKEVKGI